MKIVLTIIQCLFCVFIYGQSIFDGINRKNVGTLHADANVFFIHRSDFFNDHAVQNSFSRNSTSLGITFNYLSPSISNFFVDLSYLQTFEITKYSSNEEDGAKNLQNNEFGILNTASLNYVIKHAKLPKAIISLGRFPLNNEYMTRYRIRQKNQAYEGAWLQIPNYKRWSFEGGYLTKFSSWRSNPSKFQDIHSSYATPSARSSKGQVYAELGYKIPKSFTDIKAFYLNVPELYHITGAHFYQKLLPIGKKHKLYFRAKGVLQIDNQDETLTAFQPGILFSSPKGSIESGAFIIEKKSDGFGLENPFGAKIIISEPLIGVNSLYAPGSQSYYVESKYKWTKTSLYFLFLHTEDNDKSFQEVDIIASYAFNKKWSGSLKSGFLNGPLSAVRRQLLDVRWVLNYVF